MTENHLGGIFPLLIVEAVNTSEIGNPAFRTHAGPSEENNVIALLDDLLESLNFTVHVLPLKRYGPMLSYDEKIFSFSFLQSSR